MTLQPQSDFSIPEETSRVAHAAYPYGNTLMKMRDALGTIYQDQAFASLFPHNGRPVEAPWRLALITVLQFMEELPDRQAAEAVRGRIDWKYLLGLELADTGFDASMLCEFRKRLVQGGAEQLLLDALLTLCKERGWLKARERQRTDSTHVLAKVRAINRHMCVGEAMRETCEQTLPHLITHVATTPAPKTDEAMTEQIQEELHQADLAPGEHFVDAGYVSARVLVKSQERFGVEVVGPVSVDTQRQARTPSGIDASQFVLDWENRQAVCPQDKTSTSWSWLSRKSHPDLIKIQFSTTDCRSCPRLSDCVQSTSKYPRRTLVIRPQAQHAALQAARQRQRTETFQQRYALHARIEATISQGVRAFDLRRSRYLGWQKPHLQHLGIAGAINLVRLIAWLDGDPLAPTLVSAFERLYNAA